MRPLLAKLGGAELAAAPALFTYLSRSHSRPLALVHGGGVRITEALSGQPPRFIGGRRFTSKEAIATVHKVLSDINGELVAAASALGLDAVGIVADPALCPARHLGEGYGEVGLPAFSGRAPWDALLSAGKTPICAPLGVSEGRPVNINADDFAAALAAHLRADLLLFTDVPAVATTDGPAERLSAKEARDLIASGTAHGGMAKKLESGLDALAGGAPSCWIGKFDVPSGRPTRGTVLY